METYFDKQVKALCESAKKIINRNRFSSVSQTDSDRKSKINIPEAFKKEFFDLVDKVNLSLMEDKDNFYGYFLFQMSREIRFDIGSPTAVNFKGTKYVIYFNPILFLKLNIKQMESIIKHEILHIVSMHLSRAKEFKNNFNTLAVHMAMDIVVNKYLNYLPPYATTLERVNLKYALNLKPYESFEYYAEKLQTAIDLLEEDENSPDEDSEKYENIENEDTVKNDIENKDTDGNTNMANEYIENQDTVNENIKNENTENKNTENENIENENIETQDIETQDIETQDIETEFSVEKAHEIWEASSDIDEKTLQEFTEKMIRNSEKGEIPTYLQGMISALKCSRGELPWNLYLNRLMGTVESNKKKTITRRSRRQPDRLDLRGQLRGHKARIAVAIDISGSMSDEEFKQAMKEVLSIVKNYNHEITMIECDDKLRQVYKVKSIKDIKERINKRGGTKFNPVIEYANHNNFNLLVYFTDGKGEDKLKAIPRGYKILWVISGRGDQLSLKEPYGVVKKLSNIEIKDNLLDISEVAKGGYSMNYQESI
jgi:predicted metal-dependent peptidase